MSSAMSLWGRFKKAAKRYAKRVFDAVGKQGKAIVVDAVTVVVNVVKLAWAVATRDTAGARSAYAGVIFSARRLTSDILFGTLGTVALLLLAPVMLIQETFLLQAKPRLLTKDEEGAVTLVFGTSSGLQAKEIWVVSENLGILDPSIWSARSAPFTLGYTIYVPHGSSFTKETLIHESVHVWQFENGGPRYIAEAVRAQRWGGVGNLSHTRGYDFDKALIAGKHWPEFNPEQQAEMISYGYGQRFFAAPFPNPGMLVIESRDYTQQFIEAVRALRAGKGAAW